MLDASMTDVPFFDLPLVAEYEDKQSILKNRIRKNYRHLRKWAKNNQTNAFRIYDLDIPGYPFTIDYYAGYLYIQYFSKEQEDLEPTNPLYDELMQALTDLFSAAHNQIVLKKRFRRERLQQYEKLEAQRELFPVIEHGLTFLVNLTDYIDTGLFLDHRQTRHFIGSHCKGKRMLNLFAYTCAFSIHAAAHGAAFTKSVDMSNTYTRWGRLNFEANGLPESIHPIVRADCMVFLDQEIRSKALYDVIVIDPPTLSRSKKMQDFFDIQQDYVTLVQKALLLLHHEGVLYFSTNSRKFKFDETLFGQCLIKNISHATLPIDFHNQKIHQVWKITKR